MGVFRGIELDDLDLSDGTVRLRPWRSGDAGDVFAAAQDRQLHRFVPLPDPYTREDAEAFVGDGPTRPGLGDEGRATGTGVGSAIVSADDGRLLGAIGLRLGSADGAAAGGQFDADVGFWVSAPERGRGVATRGVRLLTSWAYSLGATRVLLWCDVANGASARVALAAGFRYEGTGRNQRPDPLGRGIAHPRSDFAHFARLSTDAGDPIAPAIPPLPPGGLGDGTIRVRPAGLDDLAALHEGETDVETRRWDLAATPRSAADLAAVLSAAELQWLVGNTARCAIVDVETAAVAGSIDLRLGPPGVAALGYTVRPGFRGRRYTTRALRLVCGWAFAAGFRRVELGAKAGNVASQRAALAAGFHEERVSRDRLRNVDGSMSDEIGFALLPADLSPAERTD